MSKIALASIKSLTFYQDGLTTARRTEPIPQLSCIGKACNLYTPEVVRCTNVGGHGADIDWKCEADLPEALRFGRVEVSCEGWSGPDDPFVLKGSCALNYRLVQVPDALRSNAEKHTIPSSYKRWFLEQDIGGTLFMAFWTSLVIYILYSILRSCLRGTPRNSSPNPRPDGHSGSGFNSFPGTYGNDGTTAPPPPYSKYASSDAGLQPAAANWHPGFWTGAAAGGLGTYLFTRGDQDRRAYDWERSRVPRYTSSSSFTPRYGFSSDDRGEGPSSGLGSMRRSTGLGGSSVR
ncbi:DUF1183-domain-containing protein [Trametopsis cervina]|nr:DUF1183-domain-containing protein [Trametopsis cervina]